MEIVIRVDNVSYKYPSGQIALNGVTLDINCKDKIGIIGPNGAGKTTLFHVITGLLKPSGGTVAVKGVQVKHNVFNPAIGLVFQNPDDQLFNSSVLDDVIFGPLNLGLKKNEAEKAAEEAMTATGCSYLKHRPSHHMSVGEKRMAAIASVISMKPEIMIYDEPASNLDARSRRALIRFIQENNATSVISSHDLEFVIETCNRVMLIDNGRIIADGTPEKILGNESLMISHGLERPHSLLHRHDHSHHMPSFS